MLCGGEGPVLRGKHLLQARLKGQTYKLPTLSAQPEQPCRGRALDAHFSFLSISSHDVV